MFKNPCKPDCPERSPTCHATCEKYFVYDICKEHERNLRYQEKQMQDDIYKTSRYYHAKKRGRAYADNHGDH